MSPAHHGRFVSYLRVSTSKQGHNGLGIEAQRSAIKQYLDGGRWKLLDEYVEVESGKVNTRPQLQKALQRCRVTNATLIIAKLDRLSRNAAFLLTLRDAGVKFVAADLPNANELTVGILAVVAEDERRRISERTKAALAEAKKAGTRLGNPHGARPLLAAGKGNADAIAAIKAQADQRARDLAETIAEIEAKGVQGARGIAMELNRREIPSPRGRTWNEIQVARLRRRLASLAS